MAILPFEIVIKLWPRPKGEEGPFVTSHVPEPGHKWKLINVSGIYHSTSDLPPTSGPLHPLCLLPFCLFFLFSCMFTLETDDASERILNYKLSNIFTDIISVHSSSVNKKLFR